MDKSERIERKSEKPWRLWLDGKTVIEGDRTVAECLTEEDARLIAAAPELLEALKIAKEVVHNMAQILDKKAPQLMKEVEWLKWLAFQKSADAAILKAQGGAK